MMQAVHSRFLPVALAATLVACANTVDPDFTAGNSAFSTRLSSSESAALALVDRRRLKGDAQRDAGRKPAEVLTFFGMGPGMVVLDLYAGGGFYTELAAYVVGECGSVWSHNNAAYLAFAAEELDRRFAPGRLANVTRIAAENNELELPANTFDLVMMVLAYHDVYYVDIENGWQRIDAPALLAEIFQAMKPGAVLGIVDHAAAAGAPADTAQTLHRIDPALLKRDLEAAGFVLEAESDVLANSADDHSQSAFAEGIRGRTDRFVFRFRRP